MLQMRGRKQGDLLHALTDSTQKLSKNLNFWIELIGICNSIWMDRRKWRVCFCSYYRLTKSVGFWKGRDWVSSSHPSSASWDRDTYVGVQAGSYRTGYGTKEICVTTALPTLVGTHCNPYWMRAHRPIAGRFIFLPRSFPVIEQSPSCRETDQWWARLSGEKREKKMDSRA